MVISHKYKLIFIKTRKTAGTSIEVLLSGLCDDRDIFSPILPEHLHHWPRNYKGYSNPFPDLRYSLRGGNVHETRRILSNFYRGNKYYNHIPAYAIRNRIGRKMWNSYFKFTVERNPFEKLPSLFFMEMGRGRFQTVQDFLKRGELPVNYPLYADPDDEGIIVDKVIRYEKLNEGLREVFDTVGIDFSSLDVRAKSDSRGQGAPRQSYKQWIEEHNLSDLVHKYFKKELEAFHYKLEDVRV